MSNPTGDALSALDGGSISAEIEELKKWHLSGEIGSFKGINRAVYPGRLTPESVPTSDDIMAAYKTMEPKAHHKFAPLNDRLLLRDASTTKTHHADGTYIPETFQQKSHEAEVIAMGRLALKEGDVCIGDIVKYSEFGHEPIEIDGEELLLVRYMDLKGVRART